MKVVILAGGKGSRLQELTTLNPKPLVKIGDLPILHHIIRYFLAFGMNEFIILAGYRKDLIQDYFCNFKEADVEVIDTGIETMTGGRLKALKGKVGETFILTYSDSLIDVNLDELLKNYEKNERLVLITAVHPQSRFGILKIEENKIVSFSEKTQSMDWVNGGYIICSNKLLDYIKSDNEILETDILPQLVEIGEVGVYKHAGFWQSLDDKRDKEILENYWNDGYRPWVLMKNDFNSKEVG